MLVLARTAELQVIFAPTTIWIDDQREHTPVVAHYNEWLFFTPCLYLRPSSGQENCSIYSVLPIRLLLRAARGWRRPILIMQMVGWFPQGCLTITLCDVSALCTSAVQCTLQKLKLQPLIYWGWIKITVSGQACKGHHPGVRTPNTTSDRQLYPDPPK